MSWAAGCGAAYWVHVVGCGVWGGVLGARRGLRGVGRGTGCMAWAAGCGRVERWERASNPPPPVPSDAALAQIVAWHGEQGVEHGVTCRAWYKVWGTTISQLCGVPELAVPCRRQSGCGAWCKGRLGQSHGSQHLVDGREVVWVFAREEALRVPGDHVVERHQQALPVVDAPLAERGMQQRPQAPQPLADARRVEREVRQHFQHLVKELLALA
eukprot:25088-Chlamydomonas_euryale.AAC.1